MGTPQFAIPTLDLLVNSAHQVVAVITVPDKPSGRGQVVSVSPVKEYASEKGLFILQPVNLKDPQFIHELEALDADLQIVVAFRMLPEVVWKMPSLGTINLHASLLPQYRGAAPINWAIINGEKETGVTTFYINENIDKGRIIFFEKTDIQTDETAGTLHDRLMETGSRLVLKTVDSVAGGQTESVSQDKLGVETKLLKPAPKIFREDCRINWQKSSLEIYNFIRGLSPYPAAFTQIRISQKKVSVVKIYNSSILPCLEYQDNLSERTPGSIITDNKSYLNIQCSDGIISIKELQLEGKRKLPVAEFLKGFKFDESWKFE